MGTTNMGCDIAKTYYRIFRKLRILAASTYILDLDFPSSGGAPASAGLALRGRWRRRMKGTCQRGWLLSQRADWWVGCPLRHKQEQGPFCSWIALGEIRGLEELLSCQQFPETRWKSLRQGRQVGVVRRGGEVNQANMPRTVVKSWVSGALPAMLSWQLSPAFNIHSWKTDWNWLSDHAGSTLAWKT